MFEITYIFIRKISNHLIFAEQFLAKNGLLAKIAKFNTRKQ